MMVRVRAGAVETIAALYRAVKAQVPVFVVTDLARIARPGLTPRGAYNYVVPVPAASPLIAVRVSYPTSIPSASEFADEMACARAAHGAGAGTEPLWFGLVEFGEGDVRSVSCWPWAVCSESHVRGLIDDDRAAFAEHLENRLVALSAVCVYVDAKLSNVMVRDAVPVLIDFDSYFTRLVDRGSAAQAAASRAFVPVAMLLIACSAREAATCLFHKEDIARALGAGVDGSVFALSELLGAACDAVCEQFDMAYAMMSVLQKYAATAARRRRPCARFLRGVVADVDARDAFTGIATRGHTGAHMRACLRLALSTAYSAEIDFRARVDSFCVDYARLTGRGRKRRADEMTGFH